MADLQIFVQRSAEDHAAVIEDVFGQQGEGAAAARQGTDGFVLVPHGEGGRLAAPFPLLQNGADMAAVAALDAGVGDGGAQKALPVRQHMDGALGAAAGAGGAAGAAVVGRQMRHGVFQHSASRLSWRFGSIIALVVEDSKRGTISPAFGKAKSHPPFGKGGGKKVRVVVQLRYSPGTSSSTSEMGKEPQGWM